MNDEGKKKLSEIIKQARGGMSQRAFCKLLGVSATAVQMWEKGTKVPDTENLSRIASRAGYTMEELLSCLEGKPIQEVSDVSLIVRQINNMPPSEVLLIIQAATNRLAQVMELEVKVS